MNPIWCKAHEIKGKKGTLLLLYIQPGASKSTLKGIHGDRLKVAIKAPPVEGEANAALIRFLSEQLGLPQKGIHLLSGDTSRMKNIWIDDLDSEGIAKKLETR